MEVLQSNFKVVAFGGEGGWGFGGLFGVCLLGFFGVCGPVSVRCFLLRLG